MKQGLDFPVDNLCVGSGPLADQRFNDDIDSRPYPIRKHRLHSRGYFGLELGIGQSAILVVGAVLGGKSYQDLVFDEGEKDVFRVITHGLVEGKEGAVLVGSVEVEEVGDLEVCVEGVEVGGVGGEVGEGEALLVLVDDYEVIGQPQEVQSRAVYGCIGQGGHDPVVVETVLV